MSTNYSLLFYLKKPKNYVCGPKPTYMRITVAGDPKEVSTGRECDPLRWNAKANRAKGTKEDIRNLNAYLDTLERKVADAHLQLVKDGVEITAESLKLKYLGKDVQRRYLMETFTEHNRKMEALLGKGFKLNTLKGYNTSVAHLASYLEKCHGETDIDIRRIDHAFITGYEFFLRSDMGCSAVSAAKYMKHLRKIVNLCLAHRWITENPFAFYKTKAKPREKEFLTPDELDRVAKKAIQGDLSPSEQAAFTRWLDDAPANRAWFDATRKKEALTARLAGLKQYDAPTALARVNRRIRSHGWFRMAIAASVLIAMGLSAWFIAPALRTKNQESRHAATATIAPGGNRATLTLADGRTIALDEAQTGIIVGDEDITYDDGSNLKLSPLKGGRDGHGEGRGVTTPTEMLALTTPKGGTYAITLPDGSKVWLNANSTLKYPSRFDGDERMVFLEGEAYFSIRQQTADTRQQTEEYETPLQENKIPFKVVSGTQTVEVLGTQFNISAYADNSETQTTLVEGAVRLSPAGGGRGRSFDLKPGQQATTRESRIDIKQVNTEPYIAWKNGYFLFEDEPLPSVMGKIAKWYDVEVVFADTPPADGFNGIISRSKNLDQVLAMLERTKAVRFTFKDKTIHVSRYN